MLTMALNIYVFQHDDIVIALNIFERARQLFDWIHFVSSEKLLISFCNAFWCVDQAFAAWIVPCPGEQGTDSVHCFFHAWAFDFVSSFDLIFWCNGIHGHARIP